MQRKGEIVEIRKILLDKVVTVRKLPLTNAGCDNLRSIQQWMKQGLEGQLKTKVELPFPTVINHVLADYVKIKSIPPSSSTVKRQQDAASAEAESNRAE